LTISSQSYSDCEYRLRGYPCSEKDELTIVVNYTVDCQQLKRTGARSAGRSAACNDFIPTACVSNMRTWGGGLACLLGHGRREAATDRVARIWEEHDSVLSIPSTPGRMNPSSFTTAALGPARAHGENSKPGRTIRPKVNGGLTTGAC
jgi:hypothetical protein